MVFLSENMPALRAPAQISNWFPVGISPEYFAASSESPSDTRQSPSNSPSEVTTGREHSILVVEDNRADVFLLREALQFAGVHATLRIATDGERAIAVIDEIEADLEALCPELIVLDLNLPRGYREAKSWSTFVTEESAATRLY